MKLPNRIQWMIYEARQILDLKRNIISTNKIYKEGYVVEFKNHSWKFIKGLMVVARVKMIGTLYLLTNISIFFINVVSTYESATIWNHILGHMSEKGIQILDLRKLLLKLKQVNLGFCDDCIYRKQKRVMFLKVGKEKKKDKLSLVYSYVWVPNQVTSFGDFSSYITFIDNATRKIWVYSITYKYDIFDTLKK